MTVASEARAAAREHPFVYDGLRAGIVNYTAAARFLDVGDTEAVGAALRRYAEELPAFEPDEPAGRTSVSMRSGIAVAEDGDGNGLLAVGGTTFVADGGEYTAIVASGDVDAAALGRILGRLRTAEIGVVAAGASDGSATVVVERRAGADAVRAVEAVV